MKPDKVKEELKKIYGEEWWDNVEEWLEKNFGYPQVYPIPEDMKLEFHPVFRDKLVSMFPIGSETGGTKKLVGHSRSSLLDYRRIFPHYIGITDLAFSSRARGNFGLVQMLAEPGDVFSRAYYNVPYPNRQKLKRLIIEAYGVTKHGRRYEDLDHYPHGGVFLINPVDDPEFDKLTKYRDYYYVPLKVRFPKNYREWLLTIDGSVLISKSAAEALKYAHRRYAIVRNPAPSIAKKFLIFKKEGIQEGAHVEFQEPLSMARFDDEEMIVGASPVDGYVVDIENLTPRVKDPKRVIWKITLEDIRPAELGAKIESATGLKNTIAGYTDDEEPVIVINPEMFDDRSLYFEVKETGKAHVYITLPGKDGNISNKGARISNTLIQALFAFPEEVRQKIVKEMFRPENLKFPFSPNVIKKIRKLDITNLDEFFPYLYYVRVMKRPQGIYYNEQETQLLRAIKEYKKRGWEKLPKFYKRAINEFIRTITGKLLLGDRDKRTAIRLNALQRIILWHDNPDTDVIMMGKELIEKLGSPEYVLWWKEPVSRQESIRCLRVEHDPSLDGHPQVIRIHPYLGKDYGENAKVGLRTKVDSVPGNTPVVIRRNGQIEIVRIDDIVKFKGEDLERVAPEEDIEVLTEQGFKKLIYVYRHKVTKKGYRIRAVNAFVETTEDHSLVVDGKEVKPAELMQIGYINTVPLPEPENPIHLDPLIAWFYGFFMAEGYTNMYVRKNSRKKGDTRYEWTVSNKDIEKLKKAQQAMKLLGYETEIKNYKSNHGVYTLVPKVRYKGERKALYIMFRNMFYTGNDKKVPSVILMADEETKRNFIKGLIDGDGHRYENGRKGISTKSRAAAAGVVALLESLGMTYTVHYRPSKNTFEIRINVSTKENKAGDRPLVERNKVTHIQEFDFEDEYVYDLTTETGTFVGGIGNVLLHNTDGDLGVVLPIKKPIDELMYHENVKFKMPKLPKSIDELPEPSYNYSGTEFIYEILEYQRYRSIENLVIQTFGGIKNALMYTDLIKDDEEWRKVLDRWDIELRAFQLERAHPELKKASWRVKGDYLLELYLEGLSYRMREMPPMYPFAVEWLDLPNTVTFDTFDLLWQKMKELRKQDHPVLQLFAYIYEQVGLL